MLQNRLKMKDIKTEMIAFGSCVKLPAFSTAVSLETH